MYKLHILENKECGGFYKEGIHSYIPTPHIIITSELWQHLLTLGQFKFIGEVEYRVYSILDKDLFVKVDPPIIETPVIETLEDRVNTLEAENANINYVLMMEGIL